MKNRVVITGMSCLTPIGIGVEEYWNNSINGVSGLKKMNMVNNIFIPDNMSKVVGKIENFEEKYGYDRSIEFAIYASEDALQMANINISKYKNINVNIATAIGCIGTMEEIVEKFYPKDLQKELKIDDFNRIKDTFQFNSVADVVSNKNLLDGESCVILTGCTGGIDAIGYSYEQIKNCETDIVITGSTEAPITPLVIASFSKIGATSVNFNSTPSEASRPFDLDRDGFVLAEGCGILILESLKHALSRGANILGEIVGYGSCSNAKHMTDIPEDGEDIYRSMILAIGEAGLSPGDIDYINLHGSSTKQNDIAETNAIKKLFGERYRNIPVTSNKSQIGHALSASNSIEIINCIKTLETGSIPPTNNVINKDVKCDLNIITKTNRNKYKEIKYILKNSSGFSGIHSSIILSKYMEE